MDATRDQDLAYQLKSPFDPTIPSASKLAARGPLVTESVAD